MSTGLASLLMAEQFGEEVDCSGTEISNIGLRVATSADGHSGGTLWKTNYKHVDYPFDLNSKLYLVMQKITFNICP